MIIKYQKPCFREIEKCKAVHSLNSGTVFPKKELSSHIPMPVKTYNLDTRTKTYDKIIPFLCLPTSNGHIKTALHVCAGHV